MLDTQEVTGSIPVRPTRESPWQRGLFFSCGPPRSPAEDREVYARMLSGGLQAIADTTCGERSALFVFDETEGMLRTRSRNLSMPLEPQIAAGLITVQQIEPAELSPGEFAASERELFPRMSLQWRTPPQVTLCLDNTVPLGCSQHQKIIVVDDTLATNVPGIWALGDCNGRGAFTHTSYNDFEIVADNLLDGADRKVGDRIPTYALFIDPPSAAVKNPATIAQ